MANKLAGGVKKGSTSYSHTIKLLKLLDGTPVTGKVAADLTATYRRQGGTRQPISLSNLAAIDSAHSGASGGGLKEDADGEYRLDLPDAAIAVGSDAADYISLHVTTADAYVYSERIPLESQGAAEVYTLLSTVSTAVTGLPAAVWAVSTRTLTSLGSLATDVWAAATRSLTSVGNIVAGVLDEPMAGHTTAGTVGKRIDDAASAGDPWETLIPGSYTAGKAGYILGTNINAAVDSRAAASALTTLQGDVTTLGTNVGAVKTKTDQLTFTGGKVAAQLLAAGDFAQACADKVWSTSARTLTGFGTLVADVITGVWTTAATRTLTAFGFTVNLASSVWDEVAANHNTAGSTGNKLNAAASAGDPWSTPIPGGYIAGQAGYVLGTLDTGATDIAAVKVKTDQLTFTTANKVDATATATVDPALSSDLAAVKAKTDQLVFTSPNLVDAAVPSLTTGALANAILRTALTEGYAADGAPFTLEQALYMLWAAAAAEKVISGSTMTVKKLDGATTAMVFTLSDPLNPVSITRTS